MKEFELIHTDPEDIEDLLLKTEDSFDIKFTVNELAYVQTFGELCDHIKGKIQLDHTNDCTTQQAFYKLRSALSSTLQIKKESLALDTLLSDVLPKQKRKTKIKRLEQKLGFELSILRPPHFVTNFLALLLLISLLGLIFNWQFGLSGLTIAIVGFWLSFKTANQLDLKTVGELVEKMTREHYLKSRRNPGTYNKNEIEKVLIDWFSYDLEIDKSKLTREARLM